jgi:hypothetical protein
MKNSLYHKIREQTNNSIEDHNELIEYVTIGRWKLEDAVDITIEAGRSTNPSATKEVFRKMSNLASLTEFDGGMNYCMDNYKYKLLEKAGMN